MKIAFNCSAEITNIWYLSILIYGTNGYMEGFNSILHQSVVHDYPSLWFILSDLMVIHIYCGSCILPNLRARRT